MSTFFPKASDIERKWYLLDAAGQTPGRIATRVASVLRGKNKALYTPHLESGDFVIVINAAKVKVVGRKATEKKYYRHTGYRGGIKETVFGKVLREKPEFIVTHAVRGMLPPNRQRDKLMKHLRVFAGDKHDMEAQQPERLEMGKR